MELEDLARRARRANEVARLRAASRRALAAPLLCFAAVVAGADGQTSALIAALLFVVLLLAGWRSSKAGDAAMVGLKLGAIPLVPALLLLGLGARCGADGASWEFASVCLAFGALSGLFLGTSISRSNFLSGRAAITLAVASLTAALGCLPMGLGGMAAVLACMFVGALSVQLSKVLRSAS